MGIVLVAFLAARATAVPARDYYVNLETDQLISQGRQAVELALRGSILDENVFAFNIAERTEPFMDNLGFV